MEFIKFDNGFLYDGGQIKPMWAFRKFGIKGSSIVTWIGPMDIKSDQVIDYEDLGSEIKANEMLHFVVEHFDTQPADIRLCYHRQRILIMITKDLLLEMGMETQRKGDDLYFAGEKLSVSIATCSSSSMKIHLGMNLITEGTPDNFPTAGLLEISSDLNHEKVQKLADKICMRYDKEISSIEEDITKTRVF
ncbi:MAG: DUF366 family protein [Methanobacteriaceae archaeon]